MSNTPASLPLFCATLTVTSAFLLALLGIAVGAFGTLVGAGGGFILVPILLLVYPHHSPELITGISLIVVFFNALAGSLSYARQRRIDYRSGLLFAACTLPGAVAGTLAADNVERGAFNITVGIFLAAVAIWLISGKRVGDKHSKRGVERSVTDNAGLTYRYHARTRLGAGLSVGVGGVSSFLGIGGGIIHVPLLVTVLGFPTHIATATSHFILVFMAFVATITHALSGTYHAGHGLVQAAALSVGVVIGAPIGAWVSQRLHGRLIQKLLAVGLLLLAVELLSGAGA